MKDFASTEMCQCQLEAIEERFTPKERKDFVEVPGADRGFEQRLSSIIARCAAQHPPTTWPPVARKGFEGGCDGTPEGCACYFAELQRRMDYAEYARLSLKGDLANSPEFRAAVEGAFGACPEMLAKPDGGWPEHVLAKMIAACPGKSGQSAQQCQCLYAGVAAELPFGSFMRAAMADAGTEAKEDLNAIIARRTLECLGLKPAKSAAPTAAEPPRR
jgi:hypothetical protein